MAKYIVSALMILIPAVPLPAQSDQDAAQIGQTPVTVSSESQGQESAEQSIAQKGQLQRFGVNLFRGRTLDMAVAGSLPENYQLGPGDQLAIYLGGKVQEELEFAVTADGKLYIPNMGVIYVNGLSMDQFKYQLNRKLKRYYSNYSLDIMLVRPKQIRVNVIGEVTNPGNYTGSALASVLDFLIMAQGPTPNGSLRNIQLYRNDSLLVHIDLYDFILRPAEHENIILQSGDKLFIPIRQASVDIVGEINREANYELHPFETERLSDLLELAGGFTDFAMRKEIKIINTDQNGQAFVKYADFSSFPNIDLSADPVLCNNDSIYVFSVKTKTPANKVSIYGEVNHTGTYNWQKDMRISDLIFMAGGVTRSAYLLKGEVATIDLNKPPKIDTFNVQDVMTHQASDIILEPDDQVFIRRIPNWEMGPTVQMQGEVQFPGIYPITKDSTYLSAIIRSAGGPTQNALLREARLMRKQAVIPEDKEFQRLSRMQAADMSESEYEYFVMKQNTRDIKEIVVDFQKLILEQDSTEDILLKDQDAIYIPPKPHVVFVTGRVSQPGGVLYHPGRSINYYISKAGGYTWDAAKRRAKVIKLSGMILDKNQVSSLDPGDRIWIPRKKEIDVWQAFQDIVMVMGQLATVYLVLRNAAGK